MRSKNTFKTMMYGFILTGIIAIIGLFKTKILLQYLGEDQVAVYQVFGNIYTYLSLIDGGITSAMIFYLYKPIRDRNKQKISEIINGVRDYFNKVGTIIIIVGLILSINIMFFIKETQLGSNYVRICCFLFIIANAVTFFMNSRSVLYEAEQRTYKASNLNHLLMIIKSIVEIVLAIMGFDLMTIIISFLALSLLKNLVLYFISSRDHKYLIKTNKMDKSFVKETNNLFVYKITNLIFENIDIVLLSSFVGSTSVIIYTAYHQITHTFHNILRRINSAIIPSIGDLLIDKNYVHIRNIFDEINSMLFYLGLVICIPLYFALNPFIHLWYGNKYVAASYVTLFFVLVLFTNIIGFILDAFIKSSGHFKSIRNWSIYQGIANLAVSLLLVHKFGILGVLIGTIFAFTTGNFISYPRIISKEVIKRKNIVYYQKCFIYLVPGFISVVLCLLINSYLPYDRLINWFISSVLIFIINFIVITSYYYLTHNMKFVSRLKSTLKRG